MALDELNKVLETAQNIIQNYGEISIDQNDLIEVGNFKIPNVKIGNQSITNEFVITNKILEITNCPCSFLYIAPEGLIRISTTVKNNIGNFIVGTLIDNTNPTTISIKSNRKEIGRGWVINDFYETIDIPLSDSNGNAYISFGIGRRDLESEREVLMFAIDNHIYAFNIMYVSEIIRVPNNIVKADETDENILGVFTHKGEIIPLIDLVKLFKINHTESKIDLADKRVIITQIEGKKQAHLVDDVLGLTRYYIKDLQKFKISEMDSCSVDTIDGVLPEVKSYRNIVVLYAEKLIAIAFNK